MSPLPLIKGDMQPRPQKNPRPWGGMYFLFLFILASCFDSLHALTITGFVRDLGGQPISLVEVSTGGTGPVDVTGPTGAYTVTQPFGSTCTISLNRSGFVFSPSSRTYINLTSDLSDQNFSYGKVWSGSGADMLASNPNNWVDLEAPVANDAVLFSSTGATKGCLWDLSVNIASFTIAVDYSSSVTPTTPMSAGNFIMEGAQIHFGSLEHNFSGHFLQTGGTFTFGTNGRINFTGTSPQTLRTTSSDLGNGYYSSYFFNVWIKGSSTVTLTSDIYVDGTFTLNSGVEFNAGSSTITLTGGRLTGAEPGSAYIWDDSQGTFRQGTGLTRFFNHPRGYRINQSAAHSFNNLTIDGDASVELISGIKVLGALQVGQPGRATQFNVGSYPIVVHGETRVGPVSNPTSNVMTMSGGAGTFYGDLNIGTATLSLTNNTISFRGGAFRVNHAGWLKIQAGTLTTFSLYNGSQFELSGGTFTSLCPTVFQSTAPGTSRFGMQLNGVVNVQQPLTLTSLDANGMRFGVGAVPINLSGLSFTEGAPGGAALNFDPVTQATITVSNPVFDASVSTNVRAILDPAVLANASVNITAPTGAHGNYFYENDPHNIVNWGTIGTPTNFSGSVLGTSSITWSWSIANAPLGFIVRSSTDGAMSPVLGPYVTSWTEINLATNTQVTRYVEAFVDIASATSNSVSRYTLAAAPSGAAFTSIQVSSVTITWNANTNPANTVYQIERSTNGTTFATVGSGVLGIIHPFVDTGLTQLTAYYYRVRARNGDGVLTSLYTGVSTTTLAVPPPVVYTMTPDIGQNLGNLSFVVRGANFQTGATLVLRRSATQIITPSSLVLLNSSTFTGTFNLLGAYAAAWDIFVQNPDGTVSSGSGLGIFSVTNAPSQGDITIKDYSASIPLNYFTTDSRTEIRVPAGTVNNGRFYASVNPIASPLIADPTTINSATQSNAGYILIPGSIRELVVFENTGNRPTGFNKSISLAIYYPDENGDGIVDNILIRASSLKMMMLDGSTGRWLPMASSSVEVNAKRVSATIERPGVWGLFGSPAANDLSHVKIYPSPWLPGSGTKFDSEMAVISELTREGTVRIYTIDAQLVREIKFSISDAGFVRWDGKNESGEKVASGVYLIHIESSAGERVIFKLGVEK